MGRALVHVAKEYNKLQICAGNMILNKGYIGHLFSAVLAL